MYYYQFHVADYAAHTRHLSPIEDLAYRRLLDLYYLHERAPSGEPEQIARLLNLREHVEEVRCVLSEFFEHRDGSWIQGRVELEIEAYRERKAVASRAGEASVAARRSRRDTANGRSTDVQRTFNGGSTDVQRPFNGRSTGVELTKNHEPRTKNHEPRSERERVRAPARPSEGAPPSAPALGSRPTSLGASEVDSDPTPTATPQAGPIAAPAGSGGPSGADYDPPTIGQVVLAWRETAEKAGMPPASEAEDWQVIDRAIRMRRDRPLSWCLDYFERVARSSWCRGEIHGDPRCRPWTLRMALESEAKIRKVLAGAHDDMPAKSRVDRAPAPMRPSKRFSLFEVPAEAPVRFAAAARAKPAPKPAEEEPQWIESEPKRLASGGDET